MRNRSIAQKHMPVAMKDIARQLTPDVRKWSAANV